MKRLFKGPWLWIVLAVVGVLVALQFIAPNGGYDEVDTSRMQAYITSGEVKEITFIDGDQEIQATLDDSVQRSGGLKVMAHWVDGQQETILAEVDKQVKAGAIESANSENPQPNLLTSFLFSLLPFLIIVLVFLWLMNQVQGGAAAGSCSSASPRPS